jgi:hypothetical protein
VGFTSTIASRDKPALTKKLTSLIAPPGFTGNAPGGLSRWSTTRSGEWQPLRPKLVVEVCYDHFAGERFRHGTRLLRWRPDKAPKQCTFEQVKQKKANLVELLEDGGRTTEDGRQRTDDRGQRRADKDQIVTECRTKGLAITSVVRPLSSVVPAAAASAPAIPRSVCRA